MRIGQKKPGQSGKAWRAYPPLSEFLFEGSKTLRTDQSDLPLHIEAECSRVILSPAGLPAACLPARQGQAGIQSGRPGFFWNLGFFGAFLQEEHDIIS